MNDAAHLLGSSGWACQFGTYNIGGSGIGNNEQERGMCDLFWKVGRLSGAFRTHKA